MTWHQIERGYQRDMFSVLTRYFEQGLPPFKGDVKQHDGLRSWLALQFQRIGDESFGRMFRDAWPKQDNSALAYQHRLIECRAGLAILGGIRFLGDELPFVDILAESCVLEDPSEIWPQIASSWASFEPVGMRVMRPGHLTTAHLEPVADQYIAAQHLNNIEVHPQLSDAGHATLTCVTAERAIATIERSYTCLPRHLRNRIFPARLEDLRRCQQDGILASVVVDGEVVGIIAVDRTSERGLVGYRMVEETILPSYRGRGHARQAQQAVIQILRERETSALLYGFIDAANKPSLRTAIACGRSIALTLWWLIDSPKISPQFRNRL